MLDIWGLILILTNILIHLHKQKFEYIKISKLVKCMHLPNGYAHPTSARAYTNARPQVGHDAPLFGAGSVTLSCYRCVRGGRVDEGVWDA